MYEKIHKAIRAVDDVKIIFFEKTVWPGPGKFGFTQVPGGESYLNRTVYSYHIYCCSNLTNKN